MRALITGAAGFIGANLTDRLLSEGDEVILIDNFSRAGSERNLAWLRDSHGELAVERVDIRDPVALAQAVQRHGSIDAVYHLAAQVAVTSSIEDPKADFETNALGTLNLLEAVRSSGLDPVFLYTSTNKVYGALAQFKVVEDETRYRFSKRESVSEDTPLDFYSPYGCSKGTADQYVRDYYRTYGLRTIVFRNSCIYGPRQYGIEDQGWVAWFAIRAVQQRPITIFGNGKQVRDLLFIDDLVDAMLAAAGNPESTAGEVYNIGGGPSNSVSIWQEFGVTLEALVGHEMEVQFRDWRLGDQRVYISDISKARSDFGWKPRVTVEKGVQALVEWVKENPKLLASDERSPIASG